MDVAFTGRRGLRREDRGGREVERVYVRISTADDDPEETERATTGLRTELLELDVENVVPVRAAAEAPSGTRAFDVAELGGLLVTFSQAPNALQQIVAAVRSWATRGDSGQERTVELVIGDDRLSVTGIDRPSQERLVEAWLRAHGMDAEN
jgi:hypothetical protein